MLTSTGRPGDGERCRQSGVAAYLTKPIKRSDLRAAIVLALGGASAPRDRPALVTRHSVREGRQTRRILLVEDNAVNQLVARRLLEKRGHTVVIANNGREALAILDGIGACLVRLCADGRPYAGDGRFRVHGRHSRRRTDERDSSPDRRDDGQRDERRRGTLPGGRDGRVSVETDSAGRALRARRAVSRPERPRFLVRQQLSGRGRSEGRRPI